MFTNEDYEQLIVKYTSKGIPPGESIRHFYDPNKIPYKLFDYWYRDTEHKIVRKVDKRLKSFDRLAEKVSMHMIDINDPSTEYLLSK